MYLPDQLDVTWSDFVFQTAGGRELGSDRHHRSVPGILSGLRQAAADAGRFRRAGALEEQTKLGLRVPDDVLPAEGLVLRSTRGRRGRETAIPHRHEKDGVAADGRRTGVVRPGLLPARVHR